MRKIVVNGNLYRYKVGKTYVRFGLPDGAFESYPILSVLDSTWNIFARGKWKKTPDGMVTPRKIKTFIENRMWSVQRWSKPTPEEKRARRAISAGQARYRQARAEARRRKRKAVKKV